MTIVIIDENAESTARLGAEVTALCPDAAIIECANPAEAQQQIAELMAEPGAMRRLYARTFGNFEFFVDGKPVYFNRSKAKEMLAYLIDRNGAAAKRQEICAALFPEREYDTDVQDYLTKIFKSLRESLEKVGAGHIIVKEWNQYRIDTSAFDSDMAAYRAGDGRVLRGYGGQYMAQYHWPHKEEIMKKLQSARQRRRTSV